MKKLGMIGGLGPESTIDYYHQLIDTYRRQQPDGSYPHIFINSVNAQKLLDAMKVDALPEIADYLAAEIATLAKAGADFGLISANTPHIVFPELARRSSIPLLSIVEATCKAAKAQGLTRVGLFGTRYTMQGKFYPDVFSRQGVGLVAPDPGDRDYIHEKYFSELFQGIFLPETREGLLAIVDRMKASAGIQGLILGGTELPLILRGDQVRGIPLLDTTKIHVEAAVAMMLG